MTYSYYDGSGHRRTVNVRKGTRIDQFLELVRQEFYELRAVSTENMLFIKEDVIIPHVPSRPTYSTVFFLLTLHAMDTTSGVHLL